MGRRAYCVLLWGTRVVSDYGCVFEMWVERERRRRTRERRADDGNAMEARATMSSSVDDYNFKGYLLEELTTGILQTALFGGHLVLDGANVAVFAAP